MADLMATQNNPGFFYTPDEQEQASELARKQALAQALLRRGMSDPGNTKYAGLRTAGAGILGAFLSKGFDQDAKNLNTTASQNYTTALGKFLNPDVSRETPPPVPDIQPSPQLSSSAGTGPQTGPAQPMPIPQPGAPSPQVSSVAASGPQQPMPQGQPSPIAPPQPNPDQARINALLSTGNPGLIQQFAPGLVQHQQERQDAASDWARNRAATVADRQRTVLSGDQATALGFKPGTVISKDPYGGIQVEQASDLKSEGAVGQEREEALFRNSMPLTKADQARLDLERSGQAETARHNKVEEGIAQNPFGTGMGAPGATGAQGEDFLKTIPPGLAAQIKAVGTYRQPAPAGRTSPTGIKFMTLVNQAYPSYDATQYGAKTKARNDFTTGKNGNTVRSLNVAVQHLDQLGQLAGALQNGNIPLVNQLGQSISQATGKPAPTNFDAAKQIVADEVIKAVVGTGGGVQDREQASAAINRASSPAQLAGVIQTYKGLMGGQLGGLKQQYEKSTGLDDFEDYLAPQTKDSLQHGAAGSGAGKGQKVGRFIVEPQ